MQRRHVTTRYQFGYERLQLFVLIPSALLALLALPASRAPGLSMHENDFCIILAIPLFGVLALLGSLPVGAIGPYLVVCLFLAAWLVQLLALQWVEGAWLHDLAGARGNS